MSNIPQDDTPRKCCTRCNTEFPATKQFFYAYSKMKDGLRQYCKTCYEARRNDIKSLPRKHHEVLPEGQKRCAQCKGIFAASNEFFANNKTRKDGFAPYCKECVNRRNQEDVENIHAYKKRYYQANKEKVVKKTKQHRIDNIERYREYAKQYNISHPEQHRKQYMKNRGTLKYKMSARVRQHTRRARKIEASGVITASDIAIQLKRQKSKCYYCKKKLGKERNAYHADHIIPLSRGGSNDPDNIVIACPSCNSRKHNKLPHEFGEGGRLC